MSTLSDGTIKELMKTRELVVEPLGENAIQPSSVDCRLGTHFLVIEQNKMDILEMDSEIHYREIEADSITIPPNSFLLATTEEYFELPDDIVGFVEGRSSIGRLGLFIQNAGLIDPGFKGKITLELYNANSLPIKLKSGRRICQMVFQKMDKKVESPYQGKYQGQMKSVGSRVFKDSEIQK